MKQRNRFLFILGPHRSGTSLIASALHSLGVSLGNRLIEPNSDNPKGFFEDEEIVRFNDRLLRSMNLSWDCFGFIWEEDFAAQRFKPYHTVAVALVKERFGDCRASGLKDPRFCVLLPFWKRVISEALDVDVSYVLGIREPDHCVRSQRTRHINDSDFHLLGRRNIQSLLLWWTYLVKALDAVDPQHLVVVNYASLVEAPEREIDRMARLLEFDLSQSALEGFCRDHVEPLLNRSQSKDRVDRKQSPLLWSYSETLYKRLCVLAGNDSIHAAELSALLKDLDVEQLEPLYLSELQYMYGYSYKKVLSLRHRLIRTIQELGDVQGEYYALRQAHESVVNTKGWRFLVFIRQCAKWLFR
ncbi:Uncharacterised protein [Halioglobus japonicus]|nr:Uncharacterised protein [Halioglobus japonicus]